MRRKLLFLTLAVVMLLAVLTISTSAATDTISSESDFYNKVSIAEPGTIFELTCDVTVKFKSETVSGKTVYTTFITLPENVGFDLKGHKFTLNNMRFITNATEGVVTDTVGGGSVEIQGGSTLLMYYALAEEFPNNTDPSWTTAYQQGWRDFVKFVAVTGANAFRENTSDNYYEAYNVGYSIPSGITLRKSSSGEAHTLGTITLEPGAKLANSSNLILHEVEYLCDSVEDILYANSKPCKGVLATVIKLKDDIAVSPEQTIDLSGPYTLDLNGHSISGVTFNTNGYDLSLRSVSSDEDVNALSSMVTGSGALGITASNFSELESAVNQVKNSSVLSFVRLTNNITAGYGVNYKSFVGTASTATVELGEGKWFDLAGQKLKTDNLFLKTEFKDSIGGGEIVVGIRSSSFLDTAKNTSIQSLGADYGYLSFVKQIALLSGHYKEAFRNVANYIPEGTELINATGSGTATSTSSVEKCVFKYKTFLTQTSPKGACATKNFILGSGASVDFSKVFNEVYLTDGLYLECKTTEDLFRPVPELVKEVKTTTNGDVTTHTNGLQKYTYTITDDLTLTADVSIPDGDVVLDTGVTLDLNGHTLTCKSLDSLTNGGKVVDLTDGIGMINTETLLLAEDNKDYLPLSDGEGYRFFEVKAVKRTMPVKQDELLNCMFYFEFSDAAAYELLANGNSGLTLNFELYFDEETKEEMKSYRFSEDTLKKYSQKYVESPGSHYAISVMLEGYGEPECFSTEFHLQTKAGATKSAASNHQQAVVRSN